MIKLRLANELSKSQVVVMRITLFLCVIILLDTYLVPLTAKVEVIKSFESYKSWPKRSVSTYTVKTGQKQYAVPLNIFNDCNLGDSLIIHSSSLSGSVQKYSINKQGGYYIYEVGFGRSWVGLVLILIIIIGGCLFLVFSDSIESDYTRNDVFSLLILAPVAFLVFHFDVNFFVD